MLKFIAAIVMSLSLFSIAPSGPKSTSVSPVEIFPAADAATCKYPGQRCAKPTDCCSNKCVAKSFGYYVCQL